MNAKFHSSLNWLISGCSTGFGRAIALAALARGHNVAATARNPDSVADIIAQYPDQAIALPLDVTDAGQVDAAVAATQSRFGSIDVLVNNAGFGYVAAIEEGDMAAVRDLFEANFFGALQLTQAVLPIMRAQRAGRIISNSSQAGVMANPGTGFYSASKYALEGMMEALGKEVAPLGIQVCSVQPGAFRTDWAGRSMQQSGHRIDAYSEQVHARIDMIAAMDGKQPGDTEAGARVFVDLAESEQMPPTLVLGKGVLHSYREKLAEVQQRLDSWEAVTLSAELES